MNKSGKGNLSFCRKCGVYHLEYGNLRIDFSLAELTKFKKYIHSLEVSLQEQTSTVPSTVEKHILLPTKLKGFSFRFSKNEMEELKTLLEVNLNQYIRLDTHLFHFTNHLN